MKVAVTLHTVSLGKGKKLEPGVTDEFSDGLYAELAKVGAIREPSEKELEIFNSLKKPVAEKAAPESTPAKKTAAKAAAKAEPEADKDADKDADSDDDEMLG